MNRKIIFGIGNQKRNMATYLMEHDENVILVVDNDIEKQGKKVNCGYIIQPVEKIIQYKDFEDVTVVITAHSVYEQMKQQLIDLGWDSNRIQIAILEDPFFSSFEYKCYIRDINLYELTPKYLNIELSGFCNCKCVYCPFHGELNLKEGHKGLMDFNTMKAIIMQIKDISSIKTVDTTGPGEIFINSNWYELLQMLLDETNIEEVYMYTNGMLLTEDNVKKITKLHAKKVTIEISIDGNNPAENDAYRIGSIYNEIKNNIYFAKKIFDKNDINLLITNCCPGDIERINNDKYLVDANKNSVPDFLVKDFYPIPIVSQLLLAYENETKISGFKKIEVDWKNIENRCSNLFFRMAINYAGELLRCSCGHAGIETIGNVFDNNILQLWKNDIKMNEARKNIKEGKIGADFCTGCPSRGIGKYEILTKDSHC